MYNKLFTKILDSSIWMEPTPTRIVWLTLIAAMDENGYVQFAGIANLAHRAILSIEETTQAVATLEGPDANSSDPEHDGRRIERIPGGWIVLNAPKYRELVTRVIIKEQTKARVAAFRAKKACNASVTQSNENVTPSGAVSSSATEILPEKKPKRLKADKMNPRKVSPVSCNHAANVHLCEDCAPDLKEF